MYSGLISDIGDLLSKLALFAWPALVAWIAWHFETEIKTLLRRVAEVKIGKGEAQVDILLQNNLEKAKTNLQAKHVEKIRVDLEKQSERLPNSDEQISDSVDGQDFARLRRMADTDPRKAILKCAELTRKILIEAAEEKGFKKQNSPDNHPLLAEAYLRNKEYISDKDYTAITSLTRFRANLQNMPNFHPRAQ